MPGPETLGEHRKWDVCGIQACTTCFCKILSMPKKKLTKYKKLILDGAIQPPPPHDLSVVHHFRASPAADHADSWLAWCYHNVAEDRADVEVPSPDGPGEEAPPPPEVVTSFELPLAEDHGKNLPKKYLPPGRLQELFEYLCSRICVPPSILIRPPACLSSFSSSFLFLRQIAEEMTTMRFGL